MQVDPPLAQLFYSRHVRVRTWPVPFPCKLPPVSIATYAQVAGSYSDLLLSVAVATYPSLIITKMTITNRLLLKTWSRSDLETAGGWKRERTGAIGGCGWNGRSNDRGSALPAQVGLLGSAGCWGGSTARDVATRRKWGGTFAARTLGFASHLSKGLHHLRRPSSSSGSRRKSHEQSKDPTVAIDLYGHPSPCDVIIS